MPIWGIALINAGMSFAIAYGGALAAGASHKQALAVALAAMTGNQSGLYQKAPQNKHF